jgi:hypothetical protein
VQSGSRATTVKSTPHTCLSAIDYPTIQQCLCAGFCRLGRNPSCSAGREGSLLSQPLRLAKIVSFSTQSSLEASLSLPLLSLSPAALDSIRRSAPCGSILVHGERDPGLDITIEVGDLSHSLPSCAVFPLSIMSLYSGSSVRYNVSLPRSSLGLCLPWTDVYCSRYLYLYRTPLTPQCRAGDLLSY